METKTRPFSGWPPAYIALFIIFWVLALIGAGVFLFGMYESVFKQSVEMERLIAGVVLMVIGNFLVFLIGKIANRRRGEN